jgi:hypothetical protein
VHGASIGGGEQPGRTLYHLRQCGGWPDTTVYNPWLGDKLGGAAAGLDFDEVIVIFHDQNRISG